MKITCVVLNDILYDNRVKKTAQKLVDFGHEVKLVCLNSERSRNYVNKDQYDLNRITLKSKKLGRKFVLLWYIEFIIKLYSEVSKSEVLYLNDLDALVAGIILKALRWTSVTVIYDTHEYQSETHGISKIKRRLVTLLETLALRYVDDVITVSPRIAKEYERLYNIPNVKVMHNVPNKYQSCEKNNMFRKEFNISKFSKIFLYQGIIDEGRGIDVLLDYFTNTPRGDETMIFMGYGALVPRVLEVASRSNNIFYKSAVGIEELPSYTSSADFGFVLIEDTCLSHRYSLPNKLFEYIQYNVPVLVSNLPEMANLVNYYNVGVVVKDCTTSEITLSIDKIKNYSYDQLQDCLQNLKNIYNWETESKILRTIIKVD
jgi:glycosyltransferase involved in cell wall biosynthesis